MIRAKSTAAGPGPAEALGTASHQFHVGSRSFAVGALLSGAVGVLATFPLVARILFPRLAARIRQTFGRIVQTPPNTHLRLERTELVAGQENGNLGYSVSEMTDAGELAAQHGADIRIFAAAGDLGARIEQPEQPA